MDDLFEQRLRHRRGGGGGGGSASSAITALEDVIDLSTPTALQELFAGLRGIVEALAVVAGAGDDIVAPPDFFTILRNAEHAAEWRYAGDASAAAAIAARPSAPGHRLIRICKGAQTQKRAAATRPTRRAPSKRAKAEQV